MKYAMDVKVNLRPVFSNLVHTDYWEGPCRVGPEETGTPEYEKRLGQEQFKIWYDELKANIDQTRCNIMEPVYIEFNESFVVRDTEFEKLLPENHMVDLYLITYRVPGIERLNKPISMINLGPTPIDLIGYYRDIGLEAYMAHDYEEYNRLLTNLQVRKAVASTKILILSNTIHEAGSPRRATGTLEHSSRGGCADFCESCRPHRLPGGGKKCPDQRRGSDPERRATAGARASS